MPVYSVKDIKGLYPYLIEIARLSKDEGDDIPGRPPYHITPNDMSLYNKKLKSKSVSPIKINGEELTPFEVVELYRQLVYQDRQGEAGSKYFEKAEDGEIEENRFNKDVVLPTLSKGHHYWGKEWTQAQRLSTLIEFTSDRFHDVVEKRDPKFRMLRGYLSRNEESPNIEPRHLYPKEIKFIRDTAQKVKMNGFEKFACLIEEVNDQMRVIEIRFPAEKVKNAHMESKAYGYTPLFLSPVDEAGANIYFPTYPQFGQRYLFDERGCAVFKPSDGEPFEKCLNLDGVNARSSVLSRFEAYFSGELAPDAGLARNSYYLRKARVYLRFRKDKNLTPEQFYNLNVVHETLHLLNSTSHEHDHGPSDLNLFHGVREFLGVMTDQFSASQIVGNYYVFVQRVALDGRMNAEADFQDMKCNNDKNWEQKSIQCGKKNNEIRYLEQIRMNAEDAEEEYIEELVYKILFPKENIKDYNWGDERNIILNPNEIEGLIPAEEARRRNKTSRGEEGG